MSARRKFPVPSIAVVAAALALAAPASMLAQAVPANLLWFDADPFVVPGAVRLGASPLPDWTSEPSGPVGALSVVVETFSGTGGLGKPAVTSAGLPPVGAKFALVNQYARDISVFQFAGADPGIPPGDLDGNGLADEWELKHFGRTGVDPAGDPDHDGFTNLAEFEAGTAPHDAGGHPEIPGIVARWSGDNSTADAVGPHPGDWSGTEKYAPGRLAGGFAFDGASSVRIADAEDLRIQGAMTLAAWVRLDRVGCDQIPLLCRPSSNPGLPAYMLSVNCQGPRLQLGTTTASYNNGPAFLPAANVWYHFAATWDGHTARIYVNGRPAFASLLPGGFGPLDVVPDRDLFIGHNGATLLAQGVIDEVVLAARDLSAKEIRWLAGGNTGPRGAIPVGSLLYEGGDQSIWRRSLDGAENSFLTHGFDARLSADRTQLAFRRAHTAPQSAGALPEQLWVRDLVTGDERVAFTFDSGQAWESFDWTQDASAVVVASSLTRRIERRAIADGSRTLLVDTSARAGAPVELTVSRANGRLAWREVTATAANDEIWIADSAGGDPKPIPGTRSEDPKLAYHSPSWSPAGDGILLKSGRDLVVVTPDGISMIPLNAIHGTLTDPVFSARPLAWTEDSTAVVGAGTLPGIGVQSRILAVGADGSGAVLNLIPEGPPVVAVVYSGGVPTEAAISTDVVFVPPVAGGGNGQLQFQLEPGVRKFRLEAADQLGDEWQPQGAVLEEDGAGRRLVVPVDPTTRVRFFRLRRDD